MTGKDRRGRGNTSRNFLLTATGSIADAQDIFISSTRADAVSALKHLHSISDEEIIESSVMVDFVNKTLSYQVKGDPRNHVFFLYEITYAKRLS